DKARTLTKRAPSPGPSSRVVADARERARHLADVAKATGVASAELAEASMKADVLDALRGLRRVNLLDAPGAPVRKSDGPTAEARHTAAGDPAVAARLERDEVAKAIRGARRFCIR